jgi:tRNA (guanine37-N1)-methyltransferase
MNFHILTIFPEIFDSYFNESIIKRGREAGLINIQIYNLRDWTKDKHRKVDDSPFGGGAGMVMKVEPIYKAIQDLKERVDPSHKVILLSARGKKWTQRKAQKYSKLNDIILICGRYEEVDERVRYFIDEEISIGEYVLTGGEIPAMVIVDSVARLIPGVLGNEASLNEESHTRSGQLEYPQYTRPQTFKTDDREYTVPDVLVSGDHKEIEEWRKQNSKRI